MKVAATLLASTLAVHAATFVWTPSTTPGATNTFYLSRQPLTNLAAAQWRYDLGARTNATATLDAGTWHIAVVAKLDIESAPALLTVIVPQPVTMLREVISDGRVVDEERRLAVASTHRAMRVRTPSRPPITVKRRVVIQGHSRQRMK